MTGEPLRRTPLFDAHREAGARVVPFAGWEMPVQYAGILEEARAVRNAVGAFDISHMGRVLATGPRALDALQRLTTNDVSVLAPGQGQYSLLSNSAGGVIDDLIVYCARPDTYLLVLNASNTEKDLAWLRQELGDGCSLDDATARSAMIAVQGPQAVAVVGEVAGADASAVPRFGSVEWSVMNAPMRLCRTGYTGEDGFEIIVPAEDAAAVWKAFLDRGVAPCGLGARDVLRTEAGYPLYGHEIDETTTPVEAGLMWVVKPDKGPFVGREAILERKRQGPGRRLVGIVLEERVTPRQGYTLLAGDVAVGAVTSGVYSPTRGVGLGMAYVQEPHHRIGAALHLAVRQSLHRAVVVPKKDLLGR